MTDFARSEEGSLGFPHEGESESAFWHRVASAWPHKSGDRLNVIVPPAALVSGRMVLLNNNDRMP